MLGLSVVAVTTRTIYLVVSSGSMSLGFVFDGRKLAGMTGLVNSVVEMF